MKEVYTIGHSTNPLRYFLNLLNKYKINCVIDVRSTPFSKYAQEYNKNELKAVLKQQGIYYIHMGEELGARKNEAELYSNEGFVDFNKVRKDSKFRTGIQRVESGVEKGYKIALMCTEKDPIDCHRCILLGRDFYENGYNVLNITQNGKIQNQGEIEQRLLDLYFHDRNQVNLFSPIIDERQLIKDAYLEKNKEIGYKANNDEGEEGI